MNKNMMHISNVLKSEYRMEEAIRIQLGLLGLGWYKRINNDDRKSNLEDPLEYISKIEDFEIKELCSETLLERKYFSKIKVRLLEEIDSAIMSLTIEGLVDSYIELINQSVSGIDHPTTTTMVRKLMLGLNRDYTGMKVADYFCGYGNFFIDIFERDRNEEAEFYGTEINSEIAAIARVAMKMKGIHNSHILNLDSYILQRYEKKKMDVVLMDAPFALRHNLHEHEVLKYGVPSKMSADWANYQIAISELKENGKAIVTAPLGALFRTSDSKIREGMIKDDRIEAIINLPSGVFSHTGIATAIIVFNNLKENNRKEKILFIDAASYVDKSSKREDLLSNELIDKILEVYYLFEEEENFSIVVDRTMLEENEYNLNVSKYMNEEIIANRLDKSVLLHEIAEVQTGVQVNKKDFEILTKDATHYFLNVKNLQDDMIEYQSAERIRDKKVNWIGKYDIKSGDLLMTTKGTLTKLVVVPDNYEAAFISNNITRIRIKGTEYNPYVLKKYFESELGQLMLESISSGTAVKVINARQLDNLQIPVFEKAVMDEVGQRIEDNIVSYHAAIEAATDKFDAEEKEIESILNFKID